MSSRLLPEVADILIRSRYTILEILSERGYNTDNYKNIASSQILTLGEGHSRALDIVVKKKEGSLTTNDRAVVIYMIQEPIRSKVGSGTFMRDLLGEEDDSDSLPNSKDDILIIINEPHNEVFEKVALQSWQTDKVRIAFFHIKQLVIHPGKHVLVPPHRKMTPEEATLEMKRLNITHKSQFPFIKHSDIQSRILGLVPGDLVEVMRPSPTAGVNRVLRICVA
jgi:DNA-directed RNA polymerase subunit H (RpoH/RPB5)